MKIEAGELTYKEAASLVWLTNGARLTRHNTVVNAKAGVVKLDDGVIRQVDAVEVQGVDEYPRRKLQYAADELRVTYSEYARSSGSRASETPGWFPFRRARKPA
jgi:hypothetical protein